MTDDPEYEAILDQFRREFRGQCAQRLELLDRCWNAVCQPDCTHATLVEFQRALHSLVGTGRTLGYDEVSTTARAAEDFIEPYCEGSGETSGDHGGESRALPAAAREEMTRLLDAVRRTLVAISA